jgi:hypothetical protein
VHDRHPDYVLTSNDPDAITALKTGKILFDFKNETTNQPERLKAFFKANPALHKSMAQRHGSTWTGSTWSSWSEQVLDFDVHFAYHADSPLYRENV